MNLDRVSATLPRLQLLARVIGQDLIALSGA